MSQNLTVFGYDTFFDDGVKASDLKDCIPGRIIAQYKERYVIQTESGAADAEVTGKLRYSASSSLDFPVVGDWVMLMQYDDLCLIHGVLNRKTMLERKAVGKFGETQPIAANIDYAMIVQSLDSDFNLNRLERYIAISRSGKIEPVVILNKSDLLSEKSLNEKIASVTGRIGKIPCIATSVITGYGMKLLKESFKPGKTFCFIGSSGVGKSSLINELTGKLLMRTGEISDSTHKGKHTTSHRELIILEGGGILIDTPGMRELGITGSAAGITDSFSEIDRLAASCKFDNCTHTGEPGCAVLQAISEGIITSEELDHYLKLEREAQHFNRSKAEKRLRDKKFGKMYKEVMKRKDRSRG
jgi:ribosome biogenesis GTPase